MLEFLRIFLARALYAKTNLDLKNLDLLSITCSCLSIAVVYCYGVSDLTHSALIHLLVINIIYMNNYPSDVSKIVLHNPLLKNGHKSFVVVYFFIKLFLGRSFFSKCSASICIILFNYYLPENRLVVIRNNLNYYVIIGVAICRYLLKDAYIDCLIIAHLHFAVITTLACNRIVNANRMKVLVRFGFYVTENNVTFLINKLSESASPEIEASILLDIDRKQILNIDCRRKMLDPFLKNDTFKKLDLNGFVDRTDFERLNCADLLKIGKLSSHPKIFKSALDIFENVEIDLTRRILMSNILIEQMEYSQNYAERLKCVALKPSPNRNCHSTMINLVALQCLKSKTDDLTMGFFRSYYSVNIKKYMTSKRHSATSILENYLREADKNAIFDLLETLSMILANRCDVNVNVFAEFDSSEWHRELLTHLLIGKVYEANDSENDLKNVVDNIASLNYFIVDTDSRIKIEDALKTIINLQHRYGFDIDRVNEILTLARATKESLELLSRGDGDDDEETFLVTPAEDGRRPGEERVPLPAPGRGVGRAEAQLEPLELARALGRVRDRDRLDLLGACLDALADAPLSVDEKRAFVRDVVRKKLRLASWTLRLNRRLADKSFASEFPKFMRNQNFIKVIRDRNLCRKQIIDLIKTIDSESKLGEMIKAFDIIVEYDLRDDKRLLTIFSESTHDSIYDNISTYASNKVFPETTVKHVDLLIEELKNLNANVNVARMQRRVYTEFLNIYRGKCLNFPDSSIISEWSESDVKTWVEKYADESSELEKIAVIEKAMELRAEQTVSEIGMLTLLTASNAETGLLIQTNGEECETTVVAMLAALHALNGRRVDVVTRRPQKYRHFSEFYSILDISVSHDYDYESDVCYGDASTFQVDVLRDEYQNGGVRRARPFRVVIVDEIDYSPIEEILHITRASERDRLPAIDYLNTVLAAIVIQRDIVASSVTVGDDDKVYFVRENGDYLPISTKKNEFVKNMIKEHIKKITNDDSVAKIDIPKHLKSLACDVLIPYWVEAAIEQNETEKLYTETLESNYISGMGFFKRYRDRIYGFAESFGNESAKRFLSKIFNVDSIIVPRSRTARFAALTPIIKDEALDDWHDEIVSNNITKLIAGSKIFVIANCDRLSRILTKKFGNAGFLNDSRLKILTVDDNWTMSKDDDALDGVKPNERIHVCFTFLPSNARVEGRCESFLAREFKSTLQFILYDADGNDFETIKSIRDKAQDENMRAWEKQIELSICKDEIFEKMCAHFKEIDDSVDFPRRFKIMAIKDNFTIWLRSVRDLASKNEILESFKKFNYDLIRDPIVYVKLAYHFIERKLYNEAIEKLTYAIELDANFSENAHYYRGFSYIAQYGGDIAGNEHFIEIAIEDLQIARRLIEKRKSELNLIQRIASDDEFSKKLSNKYNIYQLQIESINLAIGPDATEIDNEIESFKRFQNFNNSERLEIAIKTMESEKIDRSPVRNLSENKRKIHFELKKIIDCIPEDEKENYEDEILEFNLNGLAAVMECSDKESINWPNVYGLLAIGVSQLIFGGMLSVQSLDDGEGVASTIIQEGINDLTTAVKHGIISKRFSWDSWLLAKGINYSVNLINAGYNSLKDASNTLFAGVNILTGNKPLTETTKSGFKLVVKHISNEIVKSLVEDIASEIVQYSVEKKILNELPKKCFNFVQKPIESYVLNSSAIKKMLQNDFVNKNRYYENYIVKMANNLLNRKSNSSYLEVIVKIAQVLTQTDTSIPLGELLTEGVMYSNELFNYIPNYLANLDKLIIEKSEIEEIDINVFDQVDATAYCEEISNNICSILNEKVSSDIVNIIKSKIVLPTLQFGINQSLKKITSEIDASIKNEIDTYKSLKRMDDQANRGYLKGNRVKASRDIYAERKIQELIARAESGGECGLIHLGAISDVAKSKIVVYDLENRIKHVIGDDKDGPVVKIRFGEGHYMHVESGEAIATPGFQRNMCLFDAIAAQIGADAVKLKRHTLKWMTIHKCDLAKRYYDVLRLELYDRSKLILGGARYDGVSPLDAGRYLDESHGSSAHGTGARAHPRGHASDPGSGASVESYSLFDRKSGFVTHADQDVVAHKMLTSQKGKGAMEDLNSGSDKQALHFKSSELGMSTVRAGAWEDGIKVKEFDADTFTLVLRHYPGEKYNPSAPVLIQTLYPNY